MKIVLMPSPGAGAAQQRQIRVRGVTPPADLVGRVTRQRPLVLKTAKGTVLVVASASPTRSGKLNGSLVLEHQTDPAASQIFDDVAAKGGGSLEIEHVAVGDPIATTSTSDWEGEELDY